MTGVEFQGHVRSWDSKYYRKGTVVDRVDLIAPYHLEEYDFVRDHARVAVKLPITGPYTLADWSYNEYHLARQPGWKGRAQRRAAQRELVVDLARKILRPTLRSLIEHGCRVIQIDEPAAGTHPDEAPLVVEGFNEATQGLDAEFSMHICYSRYQDLLPALLEAKACRQWAWEFANRDADGHDGYEVLKVLREYLRHPVDRARRRGRSSGHPGNARAGGRTHRTRGEVPRRPFEDLGQPGLRPPDPQPERRLRQAPGDGPGSATRTDRSRGTKVLVRGTGLGESPRRGETNGPPQP